MSESDPSPRFVRFGVFEADLRTGELRRSGRKVPLQEKPFQVLALLLERAPDLVTLEQFERKLWPDVNVAFPDNLRTAVRRLREALGDDADVPRYIENLRDRGYRFIYPAQKIGAPPEEPIPPTIAPRPEPPKSVEQLVGQTVSHYHILEKLDGGAFAVVYKARDTKLSRLVALKFLREHLCSDRKALEVFRREAILASALNHPNICTIYEIDEWAGQPFIAMELLEGRTLKRIIEDQPLTSEHLIRLGIQTAYGLQAAHEKRIIHHDIKPANIFVSLSGQLKILDFGVANLLPRVDEAPGLAENQRRTAEEASTQDDITPPPRPNRGHASLYVARESAARRARRQNGSIFLWCRTL